MRFSIFQQTRVGARGNNEDRVGHAYSRDAIALVLADGMGGHLHGEVAAQITVSFILGVFEREARPALAHPALFLDMAINRAHHAIIEYAAEHRLEEVPKTTCVACIVQDGRATWAHAGDSRAYHVRNGGILARTRDHSRVQQLIDEGQLDESAVRTHPERNRIINCLGSSVPPAVERSLPRTLLAGDALLLCSDGLWGPLRGEEIARALADDDLQTGMSEIFVAAETRAGRSCDNVSAVALAWGDESVARPDDISTAALAPDSVTTRMEEFGSGEPTLADEVIERAVEDIRAAMEKNRTR
jgi:serine/threonine protein phosphatase PrpC